MLLQPIARAPFRPSGDAPVQPQISRSLLHCENERHSALASSKIEVGGIVHAECRHCGCQLMRLAASRRWFRCGEMG